MDRIFRIHTFDEKVYGRVGRSSMRLRDYLATDRTKLSNQNTFLAYIRTALTLFVAGVSFVRFFDSLMIEIKRVGLRPRKVVSTFFRASGVWA